MSVTHLVFDLGGVIVELRGLPVLCEGQEGVESAALIWQKWLTSEAPRAFESGKITAEIFAGRVVSEFSLNVSAEQYLEYFSHLPVGPFPGATDMLHTLKERYTTALFSNSNEIHWTRIMGEMQMRDAFHHHFGSHLMGMVKPDAAAFVHVSQSLGVHPGQILFFDDNQLNVEGARQVGMQAECVKGIDELRSALSEHGIPH